MIRYLVFLIAVLLGSGVTNPSLATPLCPEGNEACPVAGGFYFAVLPPVVEPGKPLGALVHFHGFRENAADIAARDDLRAIAARHQTVLVIPQGDQQTWSHPGSPSAHRDEFAFIDAVLADLAARVQLDRSRLWASGFSQGASMLWALACHRGDLFRFYMPISGGFWRPEPKSCPQLPVAIRHIHGLKDVSVPLEGRPVRGGKFHQGKIAHAIAMQREAGKCRPEAEDDIVTRGVLSCRQAKGCEAGSLEFCLHAGGHDFDPSWIDEGFRALPQIRIPMKAGVNAR
jgi:polyhydroxybutyrate depolymerase